MADGSFHHVQKRQGRTGVVVEEASASAEASAEASSAGGGMDMMGAQWEESTRGRERRRLIMTKGIQKKQRIQKQRNKSKEQDKADTRPPTRLSILRVLFHEKKDHN